MFGVGEGIRVGVLIRVGVGGRVRVKVGVSVTAGAAVAVGRMLSGVAVDWETFAVGRAVAVAGAHPFRRSTPVRNPSIGRILFRLHIIQPPMVDR
jgi:hypothetical protein